MSEEEKVDLEWLKFHWEKWRQEANRFWRHLAFGTVALLAMNLYQVDVLKIGFEHMTLLPAANSVTIKRWLICPISVWLWLSILFSLIDFLRHRVPEKYESLIHNNWYPVPGTKSHLDLKSAGRILYLVIVVSYLVILGGWVAYCSFVVWTKTGANMP